MTVGIVVPLDVEHEPWRVRAWDFVRDQLRGYGWPVVGSSGRFKDWSKGSACTAGLLTLEDAIGRVEVIVMHDADVLTDPAALRSAVSEVEAGAPWAVPHEWVHRLDETATVATYREGTIPLDPRLARLPYRGVTGGGCVVVRRDVWEACPLDPRFYGWGSEDEAWGWALDTLYGAQSQGTSVLWHLWHPHPAPGHRRSPDPRSERLRVAYRNARGVPRLTRAVIDETAPAPRCRYDEPVRFVTTGGMHTFNVLGQLVRFKDGKYATSDSDVVDVLDRIRGVARA